MPETRNRGGETIASSVARLAQQVEDQALTTKDAFSVVRDELHDQEERIRRGEIFDAKIEARLAGCQEKRMMVCPFCGMSQAATSRAQKILGTTRRSLPGAGAGGGIWVLLEVLQRYGPDWLKTILGG